MFKAKPIAIAVSIACGAPLLLSPAHAAETVLPNLAVDANSIRAGSPQDSVSTGSKTDTLLRDLPATVVVVTAENLAEQGTKNMNQAMENVSGVQPLMGGGYGLADNYTIRGLAMRFLRDGLPDGSSQNGYMRSMFDVDRLEVLKGPGSALYGSGQPGGSVNLVSKQPKFKDSAEIYTAVGSFNTRIASADVTGALNQNMAARVIAGHEESDGYRGLGRKIDQFKPTLLWKLDTDKSLTIDFDHREIRATPDNYGILFNAQRQIASVPTTTHYNSPMDYSTQKIDRVTISHDWSINADLSMHTAVVRDQRRLDFIRNGSGNGANAAGIVTSRDLRKQSDDANYTTLQNELTYKLGSGPIKHTLLGGIEFSNVDITTQRTGYNLANLNINNPVLPESSLSSLTADASKGFNRKLSSDTWSVYAQDQVDLGEQFKVRAGLRQDLVDFSDKGSQGTTAYREIKGNKTLNSGSLGGVWQPNRDWSFYTGFSSGRFINITTEANAISLEPETSSQAELGAKASLLDGRLGLNTALFSTKRENYYITLPGASAATPDGKDKSHGIEFDLTSEPIKGLNLLANYVVQNPEVTSNTNASNAALGVSGSIAGTMPVGVAKQSGRIWASYTLQGGEMRGLGFGLGVTHKGETYADSLNLYKIPAYTVFDAAIFYKQPKWEIALNIKNLTNRTYYINPTFSGALPGEERNAMLSVRFKMN